MAARQTLGGAAPSPQRLLVVDDNEDIRRLNLLVLSGAGYEVNSAEDGVAAWEALQAGSYDLVITDNNMPNMTGLELLKKIRNSKLALPIIMASGTLPTETFAQNPLLQPTATLLKPHTLEALLDTVRSVLHASQAVRPPVVPRPHWPWQASAIPVLPHGF